MRKEGIVIIDKVYIVTDGDYDEYHIKAVYNIRELAERYIELYGGDIEEYDLNPYQKELKEGLTLFQVFMRKNGIVDIIQKFLPYSSSKTGILYFSTRIYTPFDEYFVYQLVTNSEKRAIAIVDKERRVLLANGLWSKDHLTEKRN